MQTPIRICHNLIFRVLELATVLFSGCDMITDLTLSVKTYAISFYTRALGTREKNLKNGQCFASLKTF